MTVLTEYIWTAWDYYRSGGIIMVLIIVISVWMWTLIFERLTFFRTIEKKDINIKTSLDLIREKQQWQIQQAYAAIW